MNTVAPISPRALRADAPIDAMAGGRAAGAAGAEFENVLSIFQGEAGADAEQRARGAAEEFVSVALIQPILASLRETNGAAEPFAPGDAERRFGPLWDAEIAQRISKAEQFPLVDAVARRLLQKSVASESGASPASATGPSEVDFHA